MPLSEHEQRILDDIERRLAAEDPKFARSTSAATPRGLAVKRIKRATLVFIAGFVLMIAGLVSNLTEQLGIAGFIVMLIALFVKLDSRGSVFYKQERVGMDGRVFLFYKFRTMRSGSDDARES